MGKKRRQKQNSAASEPSEFNLTPLLTALVWAHFFARWLVPTEGTPEGQTLWLSASTLLVCSLWFWWQSKLRTRLSFKLIDAAVWAFVGAHILSAVIGLFGEGHKRATLNMLWEWFTLGILVTTLRQTLLTVFLRRQFFSTLIALGVALSVYGIWQHYFWYTANFKVYSEARSELDALIENDSRTQNETQRLNALQSQLIAEGVPLQQPQRGLFERRLRDSSEPLGFFALANSFAAILLVAFVFIFSRLLHSLATLMNQHGVSEDPAHGPPTLTTWIRSHWLLLASLTLLVFTLLLTKSRTAFVACILGSTLVTTLVVLQLRPEIKKRVLLLGLIAIVLLTALIAGAAMTGSLDVQVITEAPKSLNYRLLYWSGDARCHC